MSGDYRVRRLTAMLVVMAGWAVAGCTAGGAGSEPLEASGTVEATEADLGFQVPGRIEAIAVREGDPVAAGAELARLDTDELEARRAAAEAQLAAATALLAELERGARKEELAQAAAALAAADQRMEDARRDLERTRRLEEGGAVSREALDKAGTLFEVARSAYDQAREQLALLRAGARRERIAAQRAVVAQAQAAVRQMDAVLANAVVRAPFDGVVTVRHRQPGETVAPGLPVLTIMSPEDRWVRIYVREDQVGRLALGRPAVITADGFPDRSYDGRVVFIASAAEFTPRNVQTAEERVKLVFEVKVAITGDPNQDLKPGLPADVRIEQPGPAGEGV